MSSGRFDIHLHELYEEHILKFSGAGLSTPEALGNAAATDQS
jgi:hypothetical protein